MADFKYLSDNQEDILKYSKGLIGKTFNEIIKENPEKYSFKNESKSKGIYGNIVETGYFDIEANNYSSPDFKDAGLELKVTPYKKLKNGQLRIGERLVLTLINYNHYIIRDFYQSHVWDKCKSMLLVFYFRDTEINDRFDYKINYVEKFILPSNDLEIIKNDYKIITEKIEKGMAHNISEADTMYLGACTKGDKAETSLIEQKLYNGPIKAKQRAFCLKTSYMNIVLNNIIIGKVEETENIVKNNQDLVNNTFEDIINAKIEKNIGKTDTELFEHYCIKDLKSKGRWSQLAFSMLGIKSNKASEFLKSNIVVKTLRIENNKKMQEQISLPPYSLLQLSKEEWEESILYNYFEKTKFFFVIFEKYGDEYILKGSKIWNMPEELIDTEIKLIWLSIREKLQKGLDLKVNPRKNGISITNNLLKISDRKILHMRPHAAKSHHVINGIEYGNGNFSDSEELPDGNRITKQSFWIDNQFLLSQLGLN